MGTYTDELNHNLKNNQAFVFLKEKLNNPKGYVLVPVKPTDAMIEAICQSHAGKCTWPDDYGSDAQQIRREHAVSGHKAMIAAAREDG